jgi:hypothetical protein
MGSVAPYKQVLLDGVAQAADQFFTGPVTLPMLVGADEDNPMGWLLVCCGYNAMKKTGFVFLLIPSRDIIVG